MPKAVRFNQYGGVEVLQVVEVERPKPGPGQVVVRVKAAGINPGEAAIRRGLLAERFPATFPSGEGSDLAGIVEELGAAVTNFEMGAEVLGFTDNRASHAEFVLVEANHLVQRPGNLSWEVAGSLFVAGTTAYAAVRAVALNQGDTVAISGATGGVGSIAVQLAVRAGAKVIGIASPLHHSWLTEHGVIPVAHDEDVSDRIMEAAGGQLDAFIDLVGGDYVERAVQLGVQPQRINTTINFAAVAKYGIQSKGNADAGNAEVLAELANLISAGQLDMPIAAIYPLTEVRQAYQELEQHHTLGKIVLVP